MPNWGPSGETVFERTYQRTNPDGTRETWEQTVTRVITGNLSLVYGPRPTWTADVEEEFSRLFEYMSEFKILPAGRHLWASGVPGRQYLFNCHVAGWGSRLSDHYEFTFMRLMEGGGVGANYSSVNLRPYGSPRRELAVHIVCDPVHPDYERMRDAGLLSSSYSHEWSGAFPVEDSREGWSTALVDLIDTYMTDREVKHPARVYDVSRVRAEGQPLRTFGGTASGPQPFAEMLTNIGRIMNGSLSRLVTQARRGTRGMVVHLTPVEAMEIDHEIGKCVVAGGNRRSARMAMVKWDDPYVFDFIRCKADSGSHWTTNISVEIDDDFLSALNGVDSRPSLMVDGWKSVGHAKRVHEAVVTGMLTNGEPGYWNSSLSNVGEPNTVVCTNPCGEIALTPWENCNLGHVNLDAFAPTVDGGGNDWESLFEAHRLMARFLVRATYGDVNDPKQAEQLARQRRIGVGHFGVQGWLAKNGIKLSEADTGRIGFVSVRIWLEMMRDEVRAAAREYAFQLRIPEPVKVTTVAPTGSIAKLAGRTEGIHPVYAKRFIRRIRFSTVDPAQFAKVAEFAAEGYDVEPDVMAANTMVVSFPTEESLMGEVAALGLDPDAIVESADEIPLDRMLAFQALYQDAYADNAVSFTANIPAEPHQEAAMLAGDWQVPAPSPERVNEVARVLAEWLPRLKGTTLMIDGSRPQSPYERLTAEQWAELSGPTSVADSVDEECSNGACPVR